MATGGGANRTGWRSALPAGIRPYTEAGAARRPVPRHVVGLSLRDDRRDADHAAEAGRHRQVDDHRLHARLPGLQSQIPVGLGRRRRSAAAARAARPARVVDAGRPARWSSPRSPTSRSPIRQRASASVVTAAILVGIAGATFDIVIDAYRIEILEPRQLGVGSGMSQYGWRIGSAGAGALALVVAARGGWASGLSRLRGACAAGHAHRARHGRAQAPPRARREEGHRAHRRRGLAAVRRVLRSARARCSCCSSSCSTRSATRSRT